MTLSTFTAGGSFETSVAGTEYRPGACNIGPAEIARRRRAGHVGLLATAVSLGVRIPPGQAPFLRRLRITRRLQLRPARPDSGGGGRRRPRPGSIQGQPDWSGQSCRRCRCRRPCNAASAVSTVGDEIAAEDPNVIDRAERVAAPRVAKPRFDPGRAAAQWMTAW
jgi:hypothetical protein